MVNPIYRIPAIIQSANGDLLAFCEARQGGDASQIDLVSKRSTDQEWLAPVFLTAFACSPAFRRKSMPDPHTFRLKAGLRTAEIDATL